MRIMCGVLGHMGREAFGCNPKYNHWDLQNFLSYGYAKRADQFNIPNIKFSRRVQKNLIRRRHSESRPARRFDGCRWREDSRRQDHRHRAQARWLGATLRRQSRSRAPALDHHHFVAARLRLAAVALTLSGVYHQEGPRVRRLAAGASRVRTCMGLFLSSGCFGFC
jgi:hypothetical protein